VPQLLKADLEGLATASRIVANGGVICYPTDTVYGLGCDPLNADAIKRTMKAKGKRTKAMPILVADLTTAGKFALVSRRARMLASMFWPGPLTMVLEAQDILPKILTPDGTIGIRSPKHTMCLQLLKLCSGALVGTSANLTGRPAATTASEALAQIGEHVDLILDGGALPLGVASTVVNLTQPKLTILREGPLSREQLLRSLRGSRSR
jgi:L-threonylcarbamoyladenylate synthase